MSRGVRDFDLILCVRAAPCGLRAPVGGARAVRGWSAPGAPRSVNEHKTKNKKQESRGSQTQNTLQDSPPAITHGGGGGGGPQARARQSHAIEPRSRSGTQHPAHSTPSAHTLALTLTLALALALALTLTLTLTLALTLALTPAWGQTCAE